LLRKRQSAQCGSFAFQRHISKFLEGNKELLMDPELVSPHRSAISCLAVDPAMGRFVLAGSSDATISIYDLSHWGSEGFSRNLTASSSFMRFKPVARSIPIPWGMTTTDPLRRLLEIPPGHSSSINHVQWHQMDPGAFVSCSNDGFILLWDTTQMKPVLKATPFAHSTQDRRRGTWGCADWQPNGEHNLVVTGCWFDSSVKLVDVRSGASSHQLTGHTQGITAVQWSPTNPAVVASGSKDGNIRLWDIRKSGSLACLAVLKRDYTTSTQIMDPTLIRPPYQTDYSHLRRFAAAVQKKKKMNKKRKLGIYSSSVVGEHDVVVAPNNFHQVQRQGGGGGKAHNGRVGAIRFLPGGQTLASVGAEDGELLLWDLRHGPTLLERKFVAPGGLPAATNQIQTALCVDAEKDMIWISHQSTIMGFSVEGGSPKQILRGHLNQVTSLGRIGPEMTLLSGSGDGMILSWGKRKGALFTPGKPIMTQDEDNW
jgi:WD40 repeat protein